MAGDADEGGWSGTKGYKLGGLFLSLAVLSIALARGLSAAAAHMARNKRSALLHVFEHVQVELMLLGMLSLVLTALQDGLMQICVTETGSDGADYCPKGEAPLWSLTTLHQTHIFIFVLACTHVIYVGVSTAVCSWKLRQWRKWETEGEAKVGALNPKINPRNATGLVNLMWRAFWAQFRFSVTKPMYLSLRRLFLERTGATPDFNFYDYLRESMEEDMSSIIGMTALMWCMATLFVTLPEVFMLPAGLVCMGLMLFVGTLLESVALRLAQASYERFNENFLSEEEEDDDMDIHVEKTKSQKRRELRKEIDSKNFFWLGRPRLMLKIYQFVLFENAISLSLLIFSQWQDKKWLSSNARMGVGLGWGLFALDFCVLMHSALFILPVYAITSTVGSHCATSLQEYADKLGITKEAALAAYLERAKEGMSSEDAAEVAAYDLTLLEKDAERVVASGDYDHEAIPEAKLTTHLHEVARESEHQQAITGWMRGMNAIRMRAEQRQWSMGGSMTKPAKSSKKHKLPFTKDYSHENEASLTGLLGAVLSKKMKEEVAKQKAAKKKREEEKAASPGVMKSLARTFSKQNLSLDQPPATEVMEEMTIKPPAKSLTSRPSMRDVFMMNTPPPRHSEEGEEGKRSPSKEEPIDEEK